MALKIIIPEATVNLCVNPSIETEVGAWWVGPGGTETLTRTLDHARFGRASLKVVTTGAAIPSGEGARYNHNPTVQPGPITESVYVRGRGNVYLRVRASDNGAKAVWASKPIQLNDRYWQRLVCTGQLLVPETRLTLAVRTQYPQAVTFYVDGAMIEEKGHVTTYCDGDQELELAPHDGNAYFEWVGQRHATASFRTKSYRMGGQFKDLVQGLDVNAYPIEASGLGMAPLTLGAQIYSGEERATVQTVKAMPRGLSLTFHARRMPDSRECDPKSLKSLNQARKAIEDAMKPDLVHKPQSFLLRYEDGPCPMDLEAMYESGMEWEGDLRDPYVNSFGVRMFGPNPFWQADSQDTVQLQTSRVPATDHAYLIARLAGEWDGFGSASFPVRVLAIHPNGDIYAGGDFLNIGGVVVNHIARWDGSAWNGLGPSGLGPELVLNPGFETAGGGGADIWADWTEVVFDGALADEGVLVHSGAHAAKITRGTADTQVYDTFAVTPLVQYTVRFWTRGDGTNAGRYGVYDFTHSAQILPLATTSIPGTVYQQVSVSFTAPAGCILAGVQLLCPAVLGGIAYFDDVSCLGHPPGPDDGSVYAIAFAANGDVYIGGTFTTIGGVTYNRVARYTPSTDTFDTLGGASPGVNSVVKALAVSKDGYVYVGGAFTSITAGPTDAYRIARYNGPTLDTWTTMGANAGLNLDVEALEIDLDGTTVYLGGQFTNEYNVWGVPLLPYICKWTTIFEAIAEYGLNGTCRALKMSLDGKLYLAGDFTTAGWWTVGNVALWNRVDFYPLGGDGDGFTGGTRVNTIDIDNRGNVYFGGNFTGATNDSLAAYVALWNGTRFGHVDAVFPGEVLAIASKYDKLFVGYLGAALTDIADVQTVMNNGAASAYPMLDVLGPLVLRSLENQETGKLIRFNLDLQAGERVLIDLRPGFLKAVSEWRGNVIYGVLPYSDFGDFALLPGNNQIAFLGTGGDGNEEVSLRWRVTDWSFDDIR
jgi:hypothetical protein